MIITCNKCFTKFNLDESLLKKEGSRVHCSICNNIFIVYPYSPEKDIVKSVKSKSVRQDGKQSLSFEADENSSSVDEIEKVRDSSLNNDEYAYNFDDFELDVDITDDDDTIKSEEQEPQLDGDIEFKTEFEFGDDSDGEEKIEIDDGFQFDSDLEHGITFDTKGSLNKKSAKGNEEKKSKNTGVNREPDLNTDLADNGYEIQDKVKSDLNTGSLKKKGNDLKKGEKPDLSQFGEISDYDKELMYDALSEQKPFDDKIDHTEKNKQEKTDEENKGKENEKSSSLLMQELNSEEQGNDEQGNDEDKKFEESDHGKIPHDFISSDHLKKPVKTPAKVGKPVLIILFITIIILSGYSICLMEGVNIPYISDIRIPFFTEFLISSTPVTTPVSLIPDKKSINGRFVTNSSAGTLFVITGRVKNTSQIICSHIKVTGILITKGKIKAKSKTVFCGNLIAEDKLASLKMADIDSIMFRKAGNNNSNVKILPGHAIPFMIVFSNLPDNLKNFTVNVAGFDTDTIKK